MSYGHAEKLARSAAIPLDKPGNVAAPPVTPEWYRRPDMREVLAARDICALYRALTEAGLTQHQIAQLTGQSQSEVSEILSGRQVIAYDVLERIVKGLGIPRELMGMSWWAPDGIWYGPEGAYPEGDTVANLGIEMISRRLLGAGALAVFGQTVLGEPGGLPAPVATHTPLPGHLGASDVAALRDLTTRLRAHARLHGGHADVISTLARYYERLMTVDARGRCPTKAVNPAMRSSCSSSGRLG